jgi:hypothetical protein
MGGKMSRRKGKRWELAARKYFARWIRDHTHVGTDEPDIVLEVAGLRIVVECKDQATLDWPAWLRQVEKDRMAVKADLGVVLAKRRGKAMVGSAYVMMTADDLQWLLTRLEQEINKEDR